jgi:enhancing lycopene biosynthesis protein 2
METILTSANISESWAILVSEEESSLGAALHKMSQNVTVLLNMLELSQITGELLPEDIDMLMENSKQLRDQIRLLRSANSKDQILIAH